MFSHYLKPSSYPKVFLYWTLLLYLLFSDRVNSIDINDEPEKNIDLRKNTQKVSQIFDTGEFVPEVVNSTTVVLRFQFGNLLKRYPMDPHYIKSVQVNITYQLLFGALSAFQTTIFCQLQERVFMDHGSEYYQNHCRKEIFEFGVFNETKNDFSYELLNKCEPQYVSFIPNFKKGNVVTILDLLPYQSYQIKASYMFTSNQSILLEGKQEYVCLKKGRPQYPPQTDLASFSVLPHSDSERHLKTDYEIIELFWRPTPKVFVGSDETSYDLQCETDMRQPVSNTMLSNIGEGQARIKKPANQTYMCHIRSKNSLGRSPGISPIIIPDKDHSIRLGDDFKFYTFAVSNEEYFLEWTPIKLNTTTLRAEVLPRSSNGTSTLSGGNYTIYWCVSGRSKGCSNLAGIIRIGDATSYHLILPDGSEIAPRIFGISFISSSKPPMSTGIIWSKCMANDEYLSIYNQFKILRAIGVENNHTSLSIAWDFAGCDSAVVIIESYEINYCEISHLDDCSVLWSYPKSENLDDTKFETTSESCRTVKLPNRFINEATLKNLKATTRYHIRLRFILTNGTSNPWSDPVSSVTVSDPTLLTDCWYKIEVFSSLFFILTCVTCIILYSRSKRWYRHLYSILFRFKKTKASMANVVTDIARNETLSEMTLKYCINREKSDLSRANSELSLNNLASEDSFRLAGGDGSEGCNFQDTQSGHNHANQIFDYILRNLIEENNEETTPEGCSDSARGALKFDNSSEQDDISISSHPLVWDTNPDDQVDFNNNPKND